MSLGSLNSLGEDDAFVFDLEAEDKRDDAARVIQRLARMYLSIARLRAMVRANFIKKYDRVNERHYYKNKSTGEILLNKPRILGSGDLPDPRDFVAPDTYDVGEEEGMPVGYALVVVNEEFPRSEGRLSRLPLVVKNEFKELEELLSHDFICRLPQENVYCLTNPKKTEIRDTLERLKQVVRKKDYFLVYMCTHVLTIIKGEKKASETAYFAMPSTVWKGKPEEVAPTCMSLADFTKGLGKVKSRKKTVIINYCYQPAPEKAFFAPVKSIYPPPGFLARLADEANCAVVACCVSGSSMSDTLSHHPHKVQSNKGGGNSVESAVRDSLKRVYVSRKGERDEELKEQEKDQDQDNDEDKEEEGEEHHSDDEEEERDHDAEDFQTALGGGVNHHVMIDKKSLVRVAPKTPTQVLVEEYLALWQVPPDPELVLSKRPRRPMPEWHRDEENMDEVVIELPELAETRSHYRELVWWHLKRVARPVSNFFKKHYRKAMRRILAAPRQHAICLPEEEYSLFNTVMFEALRGGAHKEHKKTVTVKSLYEHLVERMPKVLEAYKIKEIKEREARIAERKASAEEKGLDYLEAEEDSEEVLMRKLSLHQSAAFYVPKKNMRAQRNPICLRCGPPAAPEKPYVIRKGTNEVSLEWYNPDFDGVPANKYEIEVRSKTRVYKVWRKVKTPAPVTKTSYTVRELPSGVECQFRVRAFNNGGWSKYSLPTAMVTPGEHLTPLPTISRWRRIVQGGPLAAIDIMLLHPLNRGEHRRGLTLLNAYASQNKGFVRATVQLKAAHAACHTLLTFHHDIELARLAFIVLIYATQEDTPGVKKVRIYLRKVDFIAIATDYLDFFRMDGAIVNFIGWIRGHAGFESIPPPPEIVIPEDLEEGENEDDDEELERLACEEDVRIAAEKERAEREERMFQERAALAKEKEAMAKAADEALKKAQEKMLRDKAEAAARKK